MAQHPATICHVTMAPTMMAWESTNIFLFLNISYKQLQNYLFELHYNLCTAPIMIWEEFFIFLGSSYNRYNHKPG
jgi:hypothetical protein